MNVILVMLSYSFHIFSGVKYTGKPVSSGVLNSITNESQVTN